jgi:uncharacterized protein with GYD domain
MAHYVTLAKFTDQGIRNVKESPKRAEAFKAMAEKKGVKVHAIFWTLGAFDMVVITEASDELAATAVNLSVASLGNIRAETLRAYEANELATIISKMA